jgi:hypothetical protein
MDEAKSRLPDVLPERLVRPGLSVETDRPCATPKATAISGARDGAGVYVVVSHPELIRTKRVFSWTAPGHTSPGARC